MSLLHLGQLTVRPFYGNNCDGNIINNASQTFNLPVNLTSTQCRLNVENGERSGCTEEKSATTVRSIRVYPTPSANSILVKYYTVGQSAPLTQCLKNTVPGTWTAGQNAFTPHRSFSPGSQVKVNAYSSTDCSGPTLQANLSFTIPNIGQIDNSTCWLDIGQNRMTGCNTGN